MSEVRGFLTSMTLLALVSTCATQAPPPASAPSALPPAPPSSERVPGTVSCISEVGCLACSDDADKDSVRMAPIVHAANVHACYARGGAPRAGAEGRVVFRIGIDPTGAVGASCVVTSSINDAAVESCLAELVLTWKFAPPKSGGWALVDTPFVVRK
jgi:TonB family protein